MCLHPLMACKQTDVPLPSADEVCLHCDVKTGRERIIFATQTFVSSEDCDFLHIIDALLNMFTLRTYVY